jgi:hypothetical protein
MSKAQKVESFTDLEIAPVLRKQRLFEAGQMKLLALHLISFAPKYGYDLIKEVGEMWEGLLPKCRNDLSNLELFGRAAVCSGRVRWC